MNGFDKTDAALREAFTAPPPELTPGFEARLRERLAHRPRRRLRSSWRWALACYVTAATIASLWILSHLPWPSLVVPRVLILALGALALASPLVLLDRIGILRPPG